MKYYLFTCIPPFILCMLSEVGSDEILVNAWHPVGAVSNVSVRIGKVSKKPYVTVA